MVDWKSPEVIASNALDLTRLLHVITGIYLWDFVSTWDFELQFILGKKKFKWPLIFYFYGRYAMLAGLITFLVAYDSTGRLNCDVLYVILPVFGNTALGMTTVNLAIRTMAIWGQARYIVFPLIIAILGQFGVLIAAIFGFKGVYVDGAGCQLVKTPHTMTAAMYLYTMVLDFIVLMLTAYKLVLKSKGKKSPIMSMLFKDGLAYFAIAFLGNLLAVVFSILQLNDVMAFIADTPASTFATMAASTVVRRLHNYVHTGPVMMAQTTSQDATKSFGRTTGAPQGVNGVRIQMTTFSHRDEDVERGQDEYKGTEDKSILPFSSN